MRGQLSPPTVPPPAGTREDQGSIPLTRPAPASARSVKASRSPARSVTDRTAAPATATATSTSSGCTSRPAIGQRHHRGSSFDTVLVVYDSAGRHRRLERRRRRGLDHEQGRLPVGECGRRLRDGLRLQLLRLRAGGPVPQRQRQWRRRAGHLPPQLTGSQSTWTTTRCSSRSGDVLGGVMTGNAKTRERAAPQTARPRSARSRTRPSRTRRRARSPVAATPSRTSRRSPAGTPSRSTTARVPTRSCSRPTPRARRGPRTAGADHLLRLRRRTAQHRHLRWARGFARCRR